MVARPWALYLLKTAHELDSADEEQLGGGREVMFEGGDEVLAVDRDIHKNVQHRHRARVDGDEAAMPVVNEKVRAKSAGVEVVDATSSVGNITQHHHFAGSKLPNDVPKCAGKHLQALRHLQRHTLCPELAEGWVVSVLA